MAEDKVVRVTLVGTWETIKYAVICIWYGWKIVGVKRNPHPTEYILKVKPKKTK